jgi:hypothetical protein
LTLIGVDFMGEADCSHQAPAAAAAGKAETDTAPTAMAQFARRLPTRWGQKINANQRQSTVKLFFPVDGPRTAQQVPCIDHGGRRPP